MTRAVSDFTIVNTNARSLCPKIHSLVDCFSELRTDIAIITETWLTSGVLLDEDIEDLRLGAGIGLLVRNRNPGARGFAHGGVAIAFHELTCSFRPIPINKPDHYKVLVALGNIPGHSRKMLVIAVYMPPGDPVVRGTDAWIL